MSNFFEALMTMDIAEPMSFDPLPKGEYHVTVDACVFGLNKKGNGMFTIDFLANEGEYENNPRRVRYWYTIVIQGKLRWDFPEFCEAAGNPLPENPTERTEDYLNQLALDIIGKTATVTLDIREYESNGEMRKSNDVKKVKWDEAKKKSNKRASRIEL